MKDYIKNQISKIERTVYHIQQEKGAYADRPLTKAITARSGASTSSPRADRS